MANRFENPLPFFDDSTGAPYVGGQLFFYVSGTSTKLITYSDSGLTIANPNPIVLDSAGRIPNAVFLQNLAYKVILAPATDTDPPTSPIWTQDPVYTSDFSTVAQFQSCSGNPTGQLAGTAGSIGIPASVAWDFTNDILYVCTTTGIISTAGWTAVNATTAAAVVPSPQGRLTLTSGTPVLNQDVTAATAVYYTPYLGLLVPIYNGASFVPLSIVSELQLTLTSSYVASNIYDFFIFLLNGVVTLGTGPSWSAGTSGSVTAGLCARGTGTGGTALARLNGILTNAVSMTMRYGNGSTTTNIQANQGTYIGSMFVDGTNGQVSCYVGWGQTRKWGIWNAFSRVPTILKGGDPTASWTYASATIRASNGASANSLTVFSGLAEEVYDLSFNQKINSGSATGANVGIGFNSLTAYTGLVMQSNGDTSFYNSPANYIAPASLGINVITSLEAESFGTPTFFGTETNMILKAVWRS